MNAEYDPRTVSACTIEWYEDRTSGRGYLLAKFDDGGSYQTEYGDPITARTDSTAIAEYVAGQLGLEVLSCEHDGEYIHCEMRQI